jgi:tetratricopeptide (TPR) repeat protein
MNRNGDRCGVLAAAIVLSLAAAHAADNAPTCSQDTVELDPASVIAPCTALLQRPNLTAVERSHALFIRGQGYHRTKRLELAQSDYDAALKLTPDNDAIYPERANIAVRFGRIDESMALLGQALVLNPKNAHALRMIGAYWDANDRLDDAIRYYTMALDADPNEAHALLFRSRAYREKRQFDLALQDADALVAMPPERINRLGYLDGDGVKRDFHIKALKNRAELYEDTGKHDLAERDLDAAVDYKRSGESLAARGEFLMDRPGRQLAALDDLQAATALDPNLSQGFYLKGLLLSELKRYPEALDAFDRAFAIDPSHDYALRMRALMYRELGQTDLAVRDMENAMTMSPRIVGLTMNSLQHSGYWPSSAIPGSMTPALRDAIRACMIDKTCN